MTLLKQSNPFQFYRLHLKHFHFQEEKNIFRNKLATAVTLNCFFGGTISAVGLNLSIYCSSKITVSEQ